MYIFKYIDVKINPYPPPLRIPNSISTYNIVKLTDSDHSIINDFSSMLTSLIVQEEEENVFYYILNVYGSQVFLQRSQLFRAIVGGLDPRSISRFEQSIKYLDILTIEWTKEFKLKIDYTNMDDKSSFITVTFNNTNQIKNEKVNIINDINKNDINDYFDDYSISIPFACHEMFTIIVPYIRFPEYIDKLISIIYKIIPYISFYIESVVNLSMSDDKYSLFENTVLYYVSLLIEIIGYYYEDNEYYINQWNELLQQELDFEKNSNHQALFFNLNNNNTLMDSNSIINKTNHYENKVTFSSIIYNREVIFKLILDFVCNLINITDNDNYSNIFLNIINYIINIPSSHGIPSTIVNIIFNSNAVKDSDLNILLYFIKHPQSWVRKHTLYELIQIEKNNLFYDPSKLNNFHSIIIKNFDILIKIINFGILDDDVQIQQLTKLFIKYFINTDQGNPILYNLILWLQIYNDKDIYNMSLIAFNKIKNDCIFNKQMILWLRMLYYKDENVRKESFMIIREIFSEIKDLSNNKSSPWNIYYFNNTDIDLLENEIMKLVNNIYKKIEITDELLKTQILKTKALLEDEGSLKKNMEELLNILINIQKDNTKINDDLLKEICIFIVDIVVEKSENLFNHEIISEFFLKILLIIIQYQNKKDKTFLFNFDSNINSQFIKNLIILSFHPNNKINYLIAKTFSYILFRSNEYQLYFKDKNDTFDKAFQNKIIVNNNLFPIQIVNSYNIYNDNVKSFNIFNYKNNEDIGNESLYKIWKVLIDYRNNIVFWNNSYRKENIFKFKNEENISNLNKSKNHTQFFENLEKICKRCYCTQDYEFLPKNNLLNALKKFLSVPPATYQDAELFGSILLFLSKFYINNVNMNEWNNQMNDYLHHTIYDVFKICCGIITNKENGSNENQNQNENEIQEIDESCASTLLSNIIIFIQSYLSDLNLSQNLSNGYLSLNKYVHTLIQYIIKLCKNETKFSEMYNQQLYWGLYCLLEFLLLPNLISNISIDHINILIKSLIEKCRDIQINNLEQDAQKTYYLLFENLRLISYYLLDVHISMKYEVNWEKYWLNENGYLLWLITGMKTENQKIKSLSYGILANIIPFKGSYKYICLQAPQFIDLAFDLLINQSTDMLLKKELISVINNFLVSFNDKIYKNYTYGTNGIEGINNERENSPEGFIDEEQMKQLEVLFVKSGFFANLKLLIKNHGNCLAYKLSLLELLLNIAQKFKNILVNTMNEQELWEDLFKFLILPKYNVLNQKNESINYSMVYHLQYYYQSNSDYIYILMYSTLKLLSIILYNNDELEYKLIESTSFVNKLQDIFIFLNAYLCGYSYDSNNPRVVKINNKSNIRKLDKFQCQVARLSSLLVGESLQQCTKKFSETLFIRKSFLSIDVKISIINVLCEMIIYQNGIENKKAATYLLARLLNYYYQSNPNDNNELINILNSNIPHHYGCVTGYFLCREIYSLLINEHLNSNSVFKESLYISLKILLMYCQSSKKYFIE
ncbi:hypothetical protein PIROE2DRAFT_7659, partial [Piromyces sp. E2]